MSDISTLIRRVLEIWAYTEDSAHLQYSLIATDIEHHLMWGKQILEIDNVKSHCRDEAIDISLVKHTLFITITI